MRYHQPQSSLLNREFFFGERTMSKRNSFAALIVCCAVVGCGSVPEKTAGQWQYYRPIAPSAQAFTCTRNPDCVVSVQANTSCNYYSGCPLDHDPIHLAVGNMNVDIVWNLPDGSGFCAELGDGVFLKNIDPDDQFDQMKPVGNPGGPNNKCKASYHWRGIHSKSNPTAPYGYVIIFHDSAGNRYVMDPWIHND